MQVLSIGEILWDVFPNQELLGGAALNFSVNVARLGEAAALITAVGNDQRGRAARQAMQSLGLGTDFVQIAPDLPTGVALVSANASGEPQFEIPRPAAFDRVELSPALLQSATQLHPDWLYYGTLMQTTPHIEQATRALLQNLPGTRGFYDMNLRPGQWSLPLIERLCSLAAVLKLNEEEAKTLSRLTGSIPAAYSNEAFCEQWSERFNLQAICITLGSAGCCVHQNGTTHTVPGYTVSVHDTVGAGDAFAAAFLHGYHRQWSPLQTGRYANALGSIVASRPGATPSWTMQEWQDRAASPPQQTSNN